MREGVRPKDQVACNMRYVCYVMLCYVLGY